MSDPVREYFDQFGACLRGVEVRDARGGTMDAAAGIRAAAGIAAGAADAGGGLLFIGNGGSAAIAGHMAADWCRNAGLRAQSFNDGPLLTCMSNDYGYAQVFAKPIELFARPQDVLFAISSSGRSENILRGAEAARRRGCRIVALSGFDPGNPLRAMGDLSFWVPSPLYGPVEVVHHALCHSILQAYKLLRAGGA